MAVSWSKKEEAALLEGVGSYGMAWFRQRTKGDRSSAAVYAKLRRSYGPGGLTRGTHTLQSVIEYSGYAKSHILRAQRALRQKWKRTGPRGAYLISDDQMDEILEWLAHDYWSKAHRLYRCLGCTSMTRPHRAVGLCGPCYFRYRRICENLELPVSVRGLRERVGSIIADECEGPIIESVMSRLGRGLVPEPGDLEWLASKIKE